MLTASWSQLLAATILALGLQFAQPARLVAGPDPVATTEATQELSPQQLARRATPAVVTIVTPTGTGSGVIVDPSGVVVTNLHVIRGDASAEVRLSNGDVYDDVRVVEIDERRDLAILKVKAFELSAAPLGNSDLVSVGDKVYVLGSPRGLASTLSDGLVSAIRDSGDGYKLIQMTAAVSPGSSGGGVFNDRGELVGVVVGRRSDAESVNFAIPVNYARGLIGTEVSETLAELAARLPAEKASASSTGDVEAEAALREELRQVLERTGLEPEPSGDGWEVTFAGNAAETVTVDISVYGDLVLMVSEAIVERALTSDELKALLRESFQLDLVKLGLYEDSVIASAELELRTLDAALLKRAIEAVAIAADDTFARLTEDAGGALTVYPPLDGPASGWRTETVDLLAGGAVLRYRSRDWEAIETDGERDRRYIQHTTGDVVFVAIDRAEQTPVEGLQSFALSSARELGADARIVRRGAREINGQPVLVLEIELTIDSTAYMLYGHYHAGVAGTVQLLGLVRREHFETYRATIETVVEGFKAKG